jgi:iron complex outermembrane receptor protein
MMAHAGDTLDTVIVTAGKIEADIQKTAISMQSLSGAKLADSGVDSVADVATQVPGLQLQQDGGGNTATVRIRGIGTPGFSALDPSVPLFIDGVAQSRTGAGFQDLIDVARIEVLRGPQGTLYGRNSTAGAINVWTKDVNTNNWEGSVLAQVGNYSDKEVKGTVNVPLIDGKLGARLSAFKVMQDGYTENGYNGETGNGFADRFGGRAKIQLIATDNLNIQLITDYAEIINHPMQALVTPPAAYNNYAGSPGGIASHPNLSGIPLNSSGLPISDKYGDVYQDFRNWAKDTNFANSLTVNWDITEGFLQDHAFTSITAAQKYDSYQELEQDHSVLQFATTDGVSKTKSWSQEFRISSDAHENWEYVGGLFYYYEDIHSDQNTDNSLVDRNAAVGRDTNIPNVSQLIPVLMGQGLTQAQAQRAAFGLAGRTTNSNSITDNNTDNAAVFGQATYSFTEKFSATAGLRYSMVEKKGNTDVNTFLYAKVAPNFMQGPIPAGTLHIIDHEHLAENDLSGVLKARYQLQDDVMLYGSFDRGFKPGGFNRLINPTAPTPTSYEKENSNNFEVGAKTQWLDNTVQANIALFHMEFLNYHNQATDSFNNVVVENIKKVTDDGVELDVQALVGPGLTVGGSAAYLNPRVKDNGLKGGGTSTTLDEDDLINDVGQYTGNLNAEYVHALGDGPAEGFVRADLSYRSSTTYGINTTTKEGYQQGGYTLSNLRFGVRKLDEHWQLTGWVNNLFDKEYAVSGAIGVAGYNDGETATRGAPVTFGVSAQYDY